VPSKPEKEMHRSDDNDYDDTIDSELKTHQSMPEGNFKYNSNILIFARKFNEFIAMKIYVHNKQIISELITMKNY
jgi:hypothetical protein